jgi:predicted alpha/beta superfamily hydrolase
MRSPLLFLFVLATSPVALAADVSIAFRVKAPPSTPADAKLYLVGDAEALGKWNPDGPELKKGDDGIYAVRVTLPADREIQYKVTRGTWATVEKNADGSEMGNRTFTPTKDTTVDVEVGAWADQVGAAKHTRTGDIRVHEKFASKHLGNERGLLVWLPPGYDDNRTVRYDVLYMHDGQNVFDDWTSFAGEWRADETAKALIEQNKIRPIIIVAIENNNRRMDEYTMTRDDRHGGRGGDGAKYAKFVAEEVKPFIDRTYRTKAEREHTGVAGSSLGATISLEIARAYPDKFGLVGALSPAAWWNDGEMLTRFEQDTSWMKGKRFWVDIGTNEGDAARKQAYIDSAHRIEALLKKAGLTESQDFHFKVIDGAPHNEKAWSARFGDVLTFLFPP